MNPTDAISVADKIAAGNDRTLLAILCVALAVGLGWAIWRLITELKTNAAERLDVTVKKIDSDNNLAAAIKAQTELSRSMLDELRARR